MTQAIESVVDLIELGAIAPENIVKCLRSALTETRQWQGLADEDREEILRWVEWKEVGSQPVAPQKLIAYIERKLRERNT